ncbi:MAG: hypothetical protein ACD_75C01059G0002 [uncultured bacterium]|nr:MAG: hypothetical protein ACD_75C01059G0002 [uncultured bacterium]
MADPRNSAAFRVRRNLRAVGPEDRHRSKDLTVMGTEKLPSEQVPALATDFNTAEKFAKHVTEK